MRAKYLPVIAVIISIFVIMSFSSCSEENDIIFITDNSNETAATPSSDIDVLSLTYCMQYNNPPDMEGQTIRIAAWWDQNIPSIGATRLEEKIQREIAAVESVYGFKYEFIQIDKDAYYDTITASIKDGTPIADIFWTDMYSTRYGLYGDNLIQPMGKSNYLNFNEDKWDPYVTETTAVGEDIYGAFWGRVSPGNVLFYNKDMINEEYIEYAVANSNWTWEEFLNLNKTVALTYKDTYALGGDYFMQMLASSGGALEERDLSGIDTRLAIYDSDTYNAFDLYYKMAQVDGVFYKDDGAYSTDEEAFLHGKIAMICDSYDNIDRYKNLDVGVIPFPMLSEEIGYVSLTEDIPFVVMAAGVTDTDKTEFALNALVDVFWRNKDSEWKEEFDELYDYFFTNGRRRYLWETEDTEIYGLYSRIIEIIKEGKQNPSDILEMFRLQFEKALKDTGTK